MGTERYLPPPHISSRHKLCAKNEWCLSDYLTKDHN